MASQAPSLKPRPGPSGENLEAILALCRKMSAERQVPALLNLIAGEAARIMKAERVTIFLLDREKSELWSQTTLDGSMIRFDARLGLAGACVMNGHIINVGDAYRDKRFYTLVDKQTGFRTRSVLAVPLRTHSGEIIGTIQALNKKGGQFDAVDEGTAQILADQAALAVDVTQTLQELKHAQDRLQKENAQLWKEVEGRFALQRIIGNSSKVQAIVRLIDQIRDSSVDVLITGPNGTGKDLVAQAIHYNSSRARRPFVVLNCAVLPENLVESELFGIENGVATGVDARVGKFEQAHGGTIFLDEIGDLTLTAQAKILRVLQERVVNRVGGPKSTPVDVRVLAATNKDLKTEIHRGTFREDLYYRLKVIPIHTPALREIPEDIPLLAYHFLTKYCPDPQKDRKRFSQAALRCLSSYSWPGNTRQLENEIKRLVATTRGPVISEQDLDVEMQTTINGTQMSLGGANPSFRQAMAEAEKRVIQKALQVCEQNQMQAAKALGLSRQGLIKIMKRHGVVRG